MPAQPTCWTMIRGAAEGDVSDRDRFARTYLPIVRKYLAARWPGQSRVQEREDAAQQVFVECLKADGVLERAARTLTGGFRAYLYGVIANVARRTEGKAVRNVRDEQSVILANAQAKDDPASHVYDREWARGLVRQAAEHMRQLASAKGEHAQRRVALLEARFEDGLPIREIAEQWGEDPAKLHHAYAEARKDFKQALVAVIRFHHESSPADVERELAEVLAQLA